MQDQPEGINIPLGKPTRYTSEYDASLLFPIPRSSKRDEIGVPDELPFHGVDIWNAYELSWLNDKGKPQVALAELRVPCESSHIIESKSLKLYFNSFNQTKLSSMADVQARIAKDLSHATQAEVEVNLFEPKQLNAYAIHELIGTCIDDLDISTDIYHVNADFLQTEDEQVEESLYSHLLKSNCLVTNQPDWGSVIINYQGKKISHEGFLKYIISFREHNEFHEQCVEHIFMDVMRQCQPEKLTVYARYTRRGGLDINPFRSNCESEVSNSRLVRQ